MTTNFGDDGLPLENAILSKSVVDLSMDPFFFCFVRFCSLNFLVVARFLDLVGVESSESGSVGERLQTQSGEVYALVESASQPGRCRLGIAVPEPCCSSKVFEGSDSSAGTDASGCRA